MTQRGGGSLSASNVLAVLGALLVVVALWSLARLLPEVLTAQGLHAASEAQFAVLLLVIPPSIAAVLCLGVALWLGRRRTQRARRSLEAGFLVACGVLLAAIVAMFVPNPGAAPVALPGAPQVRVSVVDDRLTLVPQTVTPGTIFFVSEGSASGASLIGSTATPSDPNGVPGPLSDTQVDAVARGDLFNTMTWAGLGQMTQLDLKPGKYIVTIGDPTQLAAEGGGRAPSAKLVVLTVIAGGR